RQAAAPARAEIRARIQQRIEQSGTFYSGFSIAIAVQHAVRAGDPDGAAEDLCFWLSVSTGVGAESDNEVRTNARMVIHASATFLEAPGGASHPKAPEVRTGALRVAEGAYSELSRDLQDAITRMGMPDLSAPSPVPQAQAVTAPRSSADRISSETLARFGRYVFIDQKLNGQQEDSFSWVLPLASLIWESGPGGRAAAIAELRRHAAGGAWEKVGAWKFVREFLDGPDAIDLIDAGLLTLAHDMRVTNLGPNLSVNDSRRYHELTGGPVPNDGFFGPPAFDSEYGPSRQYYLDAAVVAAARRHVTRLPHAPGVAPGPVLAAAKALWNFGNLIYRGPLLVGPDYTFEPGVTRDATTAASGVDHVLFMDAVAGTVFDPVQCLTEGFTAIGAARFAEDYLSPDALNARGLQRLLDAGLRRLLGRGELGVNVSPNLLTPLQASRLAELKGGW
ncbi:MAG: hypothetical protein ACRDNW_10405, partial [Trebonia sp.]